MLLVPCSALSLASEFDFAGEAVGAHCVSLLCLHTYTNMCSDTVNGLIVTVCAGCVYVGRVTLSKSVCARLNTD